MMILVPNPSVFQWTMICSVIIVAAVCILVRNRFVRISSVTFLIGALFMREILIDNEPYLLILDEQITGVSRSKDFVNGAVALVDSVKATRPFFVIVLALLLVICVWKCTGREKG